MDQAQLILMAIVFGAYFVGGTLGFGASIIVITFGAQLFTLDELLPVLAPLNILLATSIAVRDRAKINWAILWRRLFPLAGLGLPVGLLLFNLGPLGVLRFAFGAFVALLAGLQLRAVRPGRPAPRPLSRGLGGAMLFAGGVVHGMFSTGGPLLVYVLGREIGDKGAFRATVASVWVPLNSALLLDYALVGLVDRQSILLTVTALVPVAAGLTLGEIAHHRLEPRRFMLAVWSLLFVGGCFLAMRAYLEGL